MHGKLFKENIEYIAGGTFHLHCEHIPINWRERPIEISILKPLPKRCYRFDAERGDTPADIGHQPEPALVHHHQVDRRELIFI